MFNEIRLMNNFVGVFLCCHDVSFFRVPVLLLFSATGTKTEGLDQNLPKFGLVSRSKRLERHK